MFLKFSNNIALLGWEGVDTWHIACEICTGPASCVRADIRLIVTAAKLITTALAWVFHRVTQRFRLWNLRLAEVFLLCMLEDIHIRIPFSMVSTWNYINSLGLFRCLRQLGRGGFLRLCWEIISSLWGCSDWFSRWDNAAFAAGALARHPQ